MMTVSQIMLKQPRQTQQLLMRKEKHAAIQMYVQHDIPVFHENVQRPPQIQIIVQHRIVNGLANEQIMHALHDTNQLLKAAAEKRQPQPLHDFPKIKTLWE
jgi:hypothetical protein